MPRLDEARSAQLGERLANRALRSGVLLHEVRFAVYLIPRGKVLSLDPLDQVISDL
ncbi:hypothetical protein T261_05356 [Streptomyces lydicus]|nr:hypothetical protein T261_05356 [Streptomyces lydicus]